MTPTATVVTPPPPPPAAPDPPAAARPAVRTVITPPAGWQLVDVAELWRFRELVLLFVWRDVTVRYKQTVLGVAWAVLQPAMMMAVFTVLFGRLANLDTGGVPGPLFYLTGLLPWFFFSAAVAAGSNSVLGASGLITKVYFPRLAVPLSAVGASLADFLVACLLLVVVGAVYRVEPTGYLLAAPVVVAVVAVLAAGLGVGLAALNVTFRDAKYLVPFALQLGMYATPTIYLVPKGDEGRAVGLFLTVNPMSGLVAGFRAAVLGQPVPWDQIGVAAAVAGAVFVAGCLYFKKVEDQFADVI